MYRLRVLQGLIVLSIPLASGLAQGRGDRPEFQGDLITASRPLSYIASSLEARYGKPVTYEDPLWREDVDLVPRVGSDLPIPAIRRRTAWLPPELNPVDTPILGAAAFTKVLVDFDKRNDGLQYRVEQSSFGLHIIPANLRNADGSSVVSKNALDAVISIPFAKRTASQHLQVICESAGRQAGINVTPSAVGFKDDWYERLFAAPTGQIEWGTEPKTARSALVDLLEHSATSFTWRYYCGPSPVPSPSGLPTCVLNITRIRVAAGDRIKVRVSTGAAASDGAKLDFLEFDRCPACRPGPKRN